VTPMFLENLVVDALDPQRLGRFWEAAVGGERLTDEPDLFETRLAVGGGPVLDLCFQRVPEPPSAPSRLHVELRGEAEPSREVDRLVALGARRLDPEGDRARVALADPEGNRVDVLPDEAAGPGTGPVAALWLDSADPDRDAVFWGWLTGWAAVAAAPPSLRHPSGLGPVLRLHPERSPRGTSKNRLHLDVRLETGDDPDEVAAAIEARGGGELHLGWGVLPWRHHVDPSGNEFCVLPARS